MSPQSVPDGLPAELPCLGPTPSWASQDFISIRAQWAENMGQGCLEVVELICPAVLGGSRRPSRLKGAGIHKHVNYLKFNRHGSCRGPGGGVCLCLLFHYFPSLWDQWLLDGVLLNFHLWIHHPSHPSIHSVKYSQN